MNKCLTTDIADANRLQRAVRPTRFFNIKKMAADCCSAQCIMDNVESLKSQKTSLYQWKPKNKGLVLFKIILLKSLGLQMAG